MAVLSGMTGFARIAGEADWGHWAWEAKSVNGRGLDVRVNTPPGLDRLEKTIKTAASQHFKRGNLQIGLRIELSQSGSTITVNEAMLDQLSEAFRARNGSAPSDDALAVLMTMKGVIETSSADLRELATNQSALACLEAAGAELITELANARRDEGKALRAIFTSLLNEMEEQTVIATDLATDQPQLLKTRMQKQLAELDAESVVDAERLAVEIALSAAKADIREELDRLNTHIRTGRALLNEGRSVGRKLDFLTQELGREANTLCSKSISLDLTNAGLNLKGLIDQFKEQAANVE